MSATLVPVDTAALILAPLVTRAADQVIRDALARGEGDWQASARGLAVIEASFPMSPDAAGDLWVTLHAHCLDIRLEVARESVPVNAGAPL